VVSASLTATVQAERLSRAASDVVAAAYEPVAALLHDVDEEREAHDELEALRRIRRSACAACGRVRRC
jgi:hypothetical protein